ncbi:hypothetical protein FGO68_gene13716 [Halteria grandinella]|uniref:Transmembrane protein n=1 Tax=Halteria grandinella TaxID=5974 RepID=A0A8J8P4I1_HALGN|nr:hypothetical protein FGO68_gene13716 [Halteria grandinella]
MLNKAFQSSQQFQYLYVLQFLLMLSNGFIIIIALAATVLHSNQEITSTCKSFPLVLGSDGNFTLIKQFDISPAKTELIVVSYSCDYQLQPNNYCNAALFFFYENLQSSSLKI